MHFKSIKGHRPMKLSLSKFCDLRPASIKLFDHLTHQVCVGSYHINSRLLLVALKAGTSLSVECSAFKSSGLHCVFQQVQDKRILNCSDLREVLPQTNLLRYYISNDRLLMVVWRKELSQAH